MEPLAATQQGPWRWKGSDEDADHCEPDEIGLNHVYNAQKHYYGGLGGGASGGAHYGELQRASLHTILESMEKHTGL